LIASTFDAVATRFAPSVWFSSTAWVAAHPAQARAFVAAMHDAAVWANAHHPESAAILSKYTLVPVADIEAVRRATYGERLTPELIQPNIDVAAAYGVIKAAFPAADIIASIPG
jgi:NitT/TauT family transport system substrate-binding protein